ncbi:MAG: hypothetical protein LBH09_02070 [Peptococcaceae bacterium]|jgi:hypothetical protein|nr:hypothetical protein [Peptococcaceae bacterium]
MQIKKIFLAIILGLCLCLGLPVLPQPVAAAPGLDEAQTIAVEPSLDEPQDVPVTIISIYDRAGLEAIALNPWGSYMLAADIDLGDEPWTPIPFSGVLNGAGHTILNLTVRDCDAVTAVSVDGNAKRYETVFAALFSRAYGASIGNLKLLGVDVDVTTQQNAFAAGLVGYAENTVIHNCSVSGRIKLKMADRMCGVAGVMGFGYGYVTDCTVDVTLTLVDANHDIKCEEFMGGGLATGYADFSGCDVKVRAYTSVYGYVHNGGIAGMYFVHTDDKNHQGFVQENTIDAEIYFFEANNDRRAYCDPYVGERLNWGLQISENIVTNFVNGETRDYTKTLSPELCDAPNYTKTVTLPGCTSFGFITYTCDVCHNEFIADYTLPSHTPGDWEITREPTSEVMGIRQRRCTVCGDLLNGEHFSLLPATALEEPTAASGGPLAAPAEEASQKTVFLFTGALLCAIAALLLALLFKE